MIDLALSDEQEALVESFSALLAKASTPEQVRKAEEATPTGFDAKLWQSLLDTGAVTMGVPEAAGGWGASLLDLALVAEQVGRAAAPAPVVEAQVAARLLGRLADVPSVGDAAGPLLEAALAGEQLVTVAVRPPKGGTAGLVPAGAACDAALVPDGDRILLVRPGDDRRPVANLASAPLADLPVGGAEVLASGPAAADAVEVALDEWLVLTAAAVVGSATTSHLIGCQYAVERHAFGRPIGAFQAVAHPLADDATALDGARLLTQKAAWELDRGGPRGRELAAMAFAFASTAAEHATYDAIHVHGGYGFMLEYDVQLHYRRVRGWARVWGDSQAALQRAADARYGRADGSTGGGRG